MNILQSNPATQGMFANMQIFNNLRLISGGNSVGVASGNRMCAF